MKYLGVRIGIDVTENREKSAQNRGTDHQRPCPRIDPHRSTDSIDSGPAGVRRDGISLPANKSALPVQSTVIFVPIYIAIVIVLVFASMYLFKAVMDRGRRRRHWPRPPFRIDGPQRRARLDRHRSPSIIPPLIAISDPDDHHSVAEE